MVNNSGEFTPHINKAILEGDLPLLLTTKKRLKTILGGIRANTWDLFRPKESIHTVEQEIEAVRKAIMVVKQQKYTIH